MCQTHPALRFCAFHGAHMSVTHQQQPCTDAPLGAQGWPLAGGSDMVMADRVPMRPCGCLRIGCRPCTIAYCWPCTDAPLGAQDWPHRSARTCQPRLIRTCVANGMRGHSPCAATVGIDHRRRLARAEHRQRRERRTFATGRHTHGLRALRTDGELRGTLGALAGRRLRGTTGSIHTHRAHTQLTVYAADSDVCALGPVARPSRDQPTTSDHFLGLHGFP